MLRSSALIPLMLAAGFATAAAQPRPIEPCCGIVAINPRTGVALARNKATGKTFLVVSKDRSLSKLRIGTAINFSRKTGLSVPGASAGSIRLIKPKAHGNFAVEVDCSLTPDMCPGAKPAAKLTMNGVTTWDDVMEYCNDEIDACVDGP